MQHYYGDQVKILENTFLSTLLARLCHPSTYQPQINQIVEILYSQLLTAALNEQFEKEKFNEPTRMTSIHPGAFLEGERVKTDLKAVCVNLARAGTYPSHICYSFLHHLLRPENLRQDHIFASRITDAEHHVTGAEFGGMKIGGGVQNSYVLFPDPMGATGNTIVSAINHYKKRIQGPARKYIALHLIVTPEYLRNVLKAHPDVNIYALRLDRGLSPEAVLREPPGKLWDQERGLDDTQYIVPGGGGFGEIMNNSFV